MQPATNESLSAASPPPVPGQAGPLGQADLLLVRQAGERHKAIRSAARKASLSATITLVIGACSVPLVALSPSWDGAMVAAGICVVGLVERSGARRLRRGDPAAARLLGCNQLAFIALIVLYCAVQMAAFARGGGTVSLLSAESRSQLSGMPDVAAQLDNMIPPSAVYAFFGLVILLSVLCQGGLALYYFTRHKRLLAFRNDTPDWVRHLLLDAAG